MSTIKPEELTKEIEKALKDWEKVTQDEAVKGLKVTADQAAQKLHSADPAGVGSSKSGYKRRSWSDYNSGWKVKQDTGARGVFSMIVHNSKHYQLTHLLENGHALRNGDRSRAFPHIAPVAEEAEKELLDNIKKFITSN